MLNISLAGDCVQHAFAKQMEITKRAKAILQKKDPNSIPKMSALDLTKKYEKRIGENKCDTLQEVVHTALTLKEEGIKGVVNSCDPPLVQVPSVLFSVPVIFS